jgi:hypothetical protein
MSTRYPAGTLPGSPGSEGTGTPSLPAPALRGATLIPDTVVARITARVAREALSRQAGVSPARLGLGTPHARATVHEGSVRIDVSLDLPYPVDIAHACDAILPLRAHADDHVRMRAVLDRKGAELLLRDAAMRVPGVSGARVRVRRRHVKVRADVRFRDTAEVRGELTEVVRREEHDQLSLVRPPRLTIRTHRSPT